MRVTAKVDYAVRAMVELVGSASDQPTKAETIARHQDIPERFLLNILGDFKLAKLVESRRGSEGGYWLALPPSEVSVADVIRAVEGPLADVHGVPPELLEYPAPATDLREVWMAARGSLRRVLERTTLASIASRRLPTEVRRELKDPAAWARRGGPG